MASLNISMSAEMEAWCSDQVKTGSYSTPSEYICDLIRQDRERQERLSLAETDQLVNESINAHRSTLEKLTKR